jgi:hypothetical protein
VAAIAEGVIGAAFSFPLSLSRLTKKEDPIRPSTVTYIEIRFLRTTNEMDVLKNAVLQRTNDPSFSCRPYKRKKEREDRRRQSQLHPAMCLLVSSYKDSELTRRQIPLRRDMAFPFTPRGGGPHLFYASFLFG